VDVSQSAEDGVKAIVTRLVEARKEAGISQYRLAELSGVSREMIRQVESHSSVPSLYTFLALALALGKDPAEIFVGKREQKRFPH